MKKKAFLLGIIPCMLLCGCSFHETKKEQYSYEDTREIIKEALDEVPIETVEYTGDLTPLPLLEEYDSDETQSLIKFHQGDADQYVFVTNISEEVKKNPILNDVRLVDENDNKINYSLIHSIDGTAKYLVPVSTFQEKRVYHFEILNDTLKFVSKDASIREITYYSLEVNDSNRVHDVQKSEEDIKSYDVTKVQYFDVDAYGAYFIYDEEFTSNVGEMFRVAELDVEGDNKNTTYGRLVSVSKNPNGSGYLVRYEPCQAKDLYTNLHVNDSIVIDQDTASNVELCTDQDNVAHDLGKAFLTHEDIVTAMYGFMNHYEVSPKNFRGSMIDWASKIQVSFNMSFDGSTFTWGAAITLNLNPEDNLNIKLSLSYKQTIRYDISASLDIEYWLFVPTGVSYRLEVKEDDTKEVEFKIVLATSVNPYDADAIEEGIENDLMDAFTKDTDWKSKFAGDSPTASSDGQSYPLIRFDCYYFFPLDIRFEIDFYWKLQLTVEVDVKYTSHTQRVDVSVSNSKGCDPQSETQAQNDQSLSLNYMGSFHAEVGLKVSLGIGISGFYKFFHAEVYIAAYGAVDAQGYLLATIAWGEGRDTYIDSIAGGKFEISVGVKWGVDIALLFVSYNFEWPIASVVLIGFGNESAIHDFIKTEETVEITNQDYGQAVNLDDYHLLGVEIFDAKNYGASYFDMKHDDNASTSYGAWLNPNTKNYFSFELISGGDYITLEDYKINIKSISGIEEFDAKIKVTVNNDLSTSFDDEISKIINIHFTNNLKQEIIVINQGEESSIGTYVIGKSMYLPVPEAPRYMRFTGWKNTTTGEIISYDENDPETGKYTVPNIEEANTVKFEYVFEDYYSWSVVWADGFGNIIKIDNVMNGEAAIAPDASIRDKYMVSSDPEYEYVFIGYDTDYSCIEQNTVIRAMYEYRKVGA